MTEATNMFRASKTGFRRPGALEEDSRDESRLTLKSKKRYQGNLNDELDRAVTRLKENLRASVVSRDYNSSILGPEDQS